MLEGMWQNQDTNALLVELCINPAILEGNLELCAKGFNRMYTLWSSHTTAGFLPQIDHRENELYKNIYSCILCVGKKLENVDEEWKLCWKPQIGK